MTVGTLTKARIEKLASELRQAGFEAFFATSPVTMTYLHGLSEDGHERFLTLTVRADGDVELICPSLTANQATRAGVERIRTWADGEDPIALLQDLAHRWNLANSSLAVENTMHAKMLLEMQAALPAARFKAGQGVLSKLMSIKDDSELELLRFAGKIADEAFADGLSAVRPGATEVEVADALRAGMKKRGGSPTFTIVATGAMGAEPHHDSDNTEIRSGDVIVLDFGCSYKGYQSDITRTVCCGKASAEARKVYDIVLRAHHAARNAVVPGMPCEAIDRAARAVIEAEGYGPQFFHRVGHGIGMQGHEEPYMSPGNNQPLEIGNCFSVEPGIYLAGKFGVRIENILACGPDGQDSLNEDPSPQLIEV